MYKKLSITDRNASIKKLKGWKLVKGRSAITKTFEFKNFDAAFKWMTEIALYAEKINHHPEWSNIYNRVNVTLCTHDTNEITALDIKIATVMNKLFNN